jgi:hypothetical protein
MRWESRQPSRRNLDGDSAFARLLSGKRVAIVGPSRTTIGSRQGAALDSYDIVVRFNEVCAHLPFAEPMAKDIGTRTDVVYGNQVVFREQILDARPSARARLVTAWRNAGVEYLVCTNNSLSYENTGEPAANCRRADRTVIERIDRSLADLGGAPRFRLVRATSEMLVKWLKGNFGRTGFIAVADLLAFDIRSLYITGMTFYHGGGHIFSRPGDELHPLKNRDGTWAKDGSGLGHDSYLEVEAMKVLLRCYRHKLRVDEALGALLATPPHVDARHVSR